MRSSLDSLMCSSDYHVQYICYWRVRRLFINFCRRYSYQTSNASIEDFYSSLRNYLDKQKTRTIVGTILVTSLHLHEHSLQDYQIIQHLEQFLGIGIEKIMEIFKVYKDERVESGYLPQFNPIFSNVIKQIIDDFTAKYFAIILALFFYYLKFCLDHDLVLYLDYLREVLPLYRDSFLKSSEKPICLFPEHNDITALEKLSSKNNITPSDFHQMMVKVKKAFQYVHYKLRMINKESWESIVSSNLDIQVIFGLDRDPRRCLQYKNIKQRIFDIKYLCLVELLNNDILDKYRKMPQLNFPKIEPFHPEIKVSIEI